MHYTDVLGKGIQGLRTLKGSRLGERISELLPETESLKRGVHDLRRRLERQGVLGRTGLWTAGGGGRAERGERPQRLARLAEEWAEQRGLRGWRRGPVREKGRMAAAEGSGTAPGAGGALLAGVAAMIGAAVMYFTDPARGRRRRHIVRDKAVHALHKAESGLRKTARDVSHRAQGLAAETRAMFRDEMVTDEQLVERVRSAMGRAVSHPRAITVEARDGVVTLSGLILEDEMENLLSTVWGVRGVQDVENRLEPHSESEGIPALQGGRRRSTKGRNGGQGWSPAMRLGTGVAGGALVGYGLMRRDWLGLGLGLAGAALAVRSATNMSTRRLMGLKGERARRAVDVQKTIHINAPIEQVFEFFAMYENFPKFMSNVKEIRDLGSDRSHWVVRGPAGVDVEWDAVVTRFEPGRAIAWQSVEGSPIPNAGTIRFEEMSDGSTRVDIKLSYAPPGGALGHAAAALFGADPKSEMDEDLMRAKVALETGRPAHDARQPVGHEAFEEARVSRAKGDGGQGAEGEASGNG